MWINTLHARLSLDARRSLRLKDARGTRLCALRGTLWITLDDDPRDIVLDAGESFTVDSDKPVVVTPLGECATIDVKSQPSPRRRPTGWLQPWTARGAAVTLAPA